MMNDDFDYKAKLIIEKTCELIGNNPNKKECRLKKVLGKIPPQYGINTPDDIREILRVINAKNSTSPYKGLISYKRDISGEESTEYIVLLVNYRVARAKLKKEWFRNKLSFSRIFRQFRNID